MALLDDSSDLLGNLIPIMEKYGVRCTPTEFYEAVNLHFHAAESRVYDDVHQEMWRALPRQFELLTEDCASIIPKRKLRVLDIGCGTGLSTDAFLRTRLGSQTEEVHLLDTSREMLEIAVSTCGHGWPFTLKHSCGKISDLPALPTFDIILTCSLLHHIADLRSFLSDVAERQNPKGLFLHFQDPNADYADDPDHLRRLAEYRAAQVPARPTPLYRKLTPRRIYKRVLRQFQGRQDYIGKTNRSLMRMGIIEREMSEGDIWLVTDIRISSVTKGVSLQNLKMMLPHYDLVSSRSYAFFGHVGNHIPNSFQVREDQLIDGRSMTGSHFAGAWMLR